MIYQVIAVLIMIAFYGVYFIKLFHQHKQGIQTNLLGKGKKGFIKFIEITLKIVTYIVPVVEVISIFENTYLDLTWLRVTGVILGGFGVGVFVVSVITMRDSWRAGVPKDEKTELVTSGIYAYSRNPAFLGFDFIYIGELLMFFNWYLLAITLLAVIMLHLQIVNVEEDFLITTFGDEYLAYRKKVCRYIGRKKNDEWEFLESNIIIADGKDYIDEVRKLIEEILIHAKKAGYKEMVLDTITPLQSAIHLYKKAGFQKCEAYYKNPMADVIYFKKIL